MKLLVPIVPKSSPGPLRVIAVVKSTVRPPRDRGNAVQSAELLASSFRDYEQSAVQARSYLDIFHNGPVQITMICNTALADGNGSGLDQAMDLVAAGQVDLVITTDLTRFSRHPVEVLELLKFCARHNTRVISFEDHLDTGDDDWDNGRLTESLRSLLDTSEQD